MLIRPEEFNDIPAIRHVNQQAFGRPQEADLVEALRAKGRVVLSLVALRESELIGHILFFSLEIQSSQHSHAAVGLGPMAVLPKHQKRGIGAALIREGLSLLQQQQVHPGVIVLGHADYYPRFGFGLASTFGITTSYDVPDDVFMAHELYSGAFADKGGTVIYSDEFDAV